LEFCVNRRSACYSEELQCTLSLPPRDILAAYVIFFASYVVFALGKFPGLKIDRTGAAIIGAIGMVAFRIVGAKEALRSIDFSTIVLLFSRMLIVGNLHLVGFFEWNAEAVLRQLKPHHLLPAVIFTSGLLSAFSSMTSFAF
jgi:Na+/H+ antiporter NhaD/arsenite permease-like protein